MTIDAAFFKERLRDELARFTPLAIDALVAAVVGAGAASEYETLLGGAGEEEESAGADAPAG